MTYPLNIQASDLFRQTWTNQLPYIRMGWNTGSSLLQFVRELRGGLKPRTKVLSVLQSPFYHTLDSWDFSSFQKKSLGTYEFHIPGERMVRQKTMHKEGPGRLAGFCATGQASESWLASQMLTPQSLVVLGEVNGGRHQILITLGCSFSLFSHHIFHLSLKHCHSVKPCAAFSSFESP